MDEMWLIIELLQNNIIRKNINIADIFVVDVINKNINDVSIIEDNPSSLTNCKFSTHFYIKKRLEIYREFK